MDFIFFNTWNLLPFNQWYHKKLKINTIMWTFVDYDYLKKRATILCIDLVVPFQV
jgi:hypothetical protein